MLPSSLSSHHPYSSNALSEIKIKTKARIRRDLQKRLFIFFVIFSSLVSICYFIVFHVELSSLEFFTSTQLHRTNKKSASEYPTLNCANYGGPRYNDPNDNYANEMVYWKNVDSHDSSFRSPYLPTSNEGEPVQEKFLTFEPDDAGWNNVRMGFETIVIIALITGRTLVLPPESTNVLFKKYGANANEMNRNEQKNFTIHHPSKERFNFHDFYNLTSLTKKYANLKIISMDQYLREEGLNGRLKDRIGNSIVPPLHQVHWEGRNPVLNNYLRNVAYIPMHWKPNKCLAYFDDPNLHTTSMNIKHSHNNSQDTTQSTSFDPQNLIRDILSRKNGNRVPFPHQFHNKPTPVNATMTERLRESIAQRTQICHYSPEMQWQTIIHFPFDPLLFADQRMLTHFYSFLFHENYHQDLFTKRFVRDGLHYKESIVCAAATIVKQLRTRAYERNPESNPTGEFHTFHVRRNDFQTQFKMTEGNVESIFKTSSMENLPPGSTIYVATDEKDIRTFFEPITEIYDLVFFNDFLHLLDGFSDIQEHHFGMIEQLIAARGKVFHGLYYSTFSAHVMRLRGYYSVKEKHLKDGSLKNSFYYMPDFALSEMNDYRAIRMPSFLREYPTAWRDIDNDVENTDENIS